jgi:hypothetical protein
VETCWIGDPDGLAVVCLTEKEWLAYADRLQDQKLPRHLMLGHSDNAQPYALEACRDFRSELFPELPPLPNGWLTPESIAEFSPIPSPKRWTFSTPDTVTARRKA